MSPVSPAQFVALFFPLSGILEIPPLFLIDSSEVFISLLKPFIRPTLAPDTSIDLENLFSKNIVSKIRIIKQKEKISLNISKGK